MPRSGIAGSYSNYRARDFLKREWSSSIGVGKGPIPKRIVIEDDHGYKVSIRNDCIFLKKEITS